MFGFGTTEILLIAGAGIVIFGARRLPEIGAALGKGFRNFRKTIEGKDEEAETNEEPDTKSKKTKA